MTLTLIFSIFLFKKLPRFPTLCIESTLLVSNEHTEREGRLVVSKKLFIYEILQKPTK